MDNISSLFNSSVELQTITKSLDEGISPILVHGAEFSALRHLAHSLRLISNRDILILFDDETKAKHASEELCTQFLPTKDIVWFSSYAHSKLREIQRTETLLSLNTKPREPISVCSSVQNLSYKFHGQFENFKDGISFVVGEEHNFASIPGELYSFGYERVDTVLTKGQYAIRGGVVDIFSTKQNLPIRIEFFDEMVDSIRFFDPEKQTSTENIKACTIFPVREIVFNNEAKTQYLKRANLIFEKTGLKKLEKLIFSLENDEYIENIEQYFSLLFDKTEQFSILDYMNNPIVFFIGGDTCLGRLDGYLLDSQKQFVEYLTRGEVISDQFGINFTFDEILARLSRGSVVTSELLLKNVRLSPAQIVKIPSKEIEKYFGNFEELAMDLKRKCLKGYKILVTFFSEDKMDAFESSLREFEMGVIKESVPKSGVITVSLREVESGFLFETFKAFLLTENEVFGERKRLSRKGTKKAREIKALGELEKGDYVVHDTHGIGQFIGIEQIVVDRKRKDYLKIKYSGDDYLYIPAESTFLIQKYMGTDIEKLKLSKMGGNEWKRTKASARKAIEDITDELIELYAKRQESRGFAFSKDNEWQREFEDQFPYKETNDQLRCIGEIKEDMEKPIPMERLLCGDVGYGKTEVALRAAFKAVMDSKQVAILVPTTVLAQQHYLNIVERFSKYPTNIRTISRFRSKKEINETIRGLITGSVDVVVGTHRLLSSDIQFANLGLLIIDEEQRFGVKHKEKIKQLKNQIDVLTLSATPIPRTLHMSMLGIRDMSVIEDPPEDRYPVQTFVIEYDEQTIREAILREVERGGQVYFVHNNTRNIDTLTAKLSSLVPEATFSFAHGQMPEGRLEDVMMSFIAKDFDVLVSTTIIETGMDISNVNTIIINDGDRFGLSQLYQLRGRVGRSSRVAYCYIMFQENKVLSEIAEKRLKAIKEFTELGAGFKISMRDLELRGAGNILGTEQHGYLDAIGYDLYARMLEEAIDKKKGKVVHDRISAKINLSIDAFIPEDYITSPQTKIDMYKIISQISSKEMSMAVYEELLDRFGEVPKPTQNLITIALIRSLCEQMSIVDVVANEKIVLTFEKDYLVSPLFASRVVDMDRSSITLFAGQPSKITIKINKGLRSSEQVLEALEKYILKMYSFHSEFLN